MKRYSTHVSARIWICLAVLTLLTACSSEDETISSIPSKAPEPSNAGANASEPAAKSAQEKLEDPSLRAAYITARQAEAANDSAYAFSEASRYSTTLRSKTDARTVTHRALSLTKKMQTELVSDGAVRVTPMGRADEVSAQAVELKLMSWGADARLQEVPSVTARSTKNNRIELTRGAISEWYVNGSLGLEQGFTIRETPNPGASELVIELAISGVEPKLAPDGKSVQFLRSAGVSVGGYSDLFVKDANGQRLTAKLSVAADKIRISVETTGAAFPINIDPLIWIGTKLMKLDEAASGALGQAVATSGDTVLVGASFGPVHVFVHSGGSWVLQQKISAPNSPLNFGASVALDGDTALIGAYGDNGTAVSSGTAYVFVRSNNVWTPQGEKLFANDGQAGDAFGISVALSGNTALIGAYSDDDNGDHSGAAYVFVRSGSAWSQQKKLLADDNAAGDSFGESVALSPDAALIGAPGDSDNGDHAGSAYVFARSGINEWTQQKKLLANDGVSWDSFGSAVALSGDTALVGAFYDDDNGTDSGSAYVFVNTGSDWTQQQKLLADDGVDFDYFGYAVTLDGDTAAIGASLDDDKGGNSGSGYIFTRIGTVWSQQQKLLCPEGISGDNFGSSMALSGGTAFVGALYNGGYVSVFARSGSSWAQQQRLLALDSSIADNFGVSVAFSGDTAVVGAPLADDNGTDSGAAYVFVRSGSSWAQQQKLLALDGAAADNFGTSVGVSGETILIGAPGDDTSRGSAYAFLRSGTTWLQQQKLLASDGAATDAFGSSVALSGETALIGAHFDDDKGANAGAAYAFLRTGTTWAQQQKLLATDGAANDDFGGAVAISGDTALVGASFDTEVDDIGTGSAYVFLRTGTTWAQQQKLLASDHAAFDHFGNAVAISGDTALVGDNEDDNQKGSAFVFTRNGTTWTQQQKLSASDGVADDKFGGSVAISGDTSLVGALWNDTGKGASYVFVRVGTTWSEQQKLLAPDGASYHLGYAVAISNDTAIATEVGASSSSAYAFQAYDGTSVLGTPCIEDYQCGSSHCVEGICCNSACAGACQSCSQWSKADASADGTCGQVATGSACGPAPNSCSSKTEYELTPTCDANGACQTHTIACTGGFACVSGVANGFCAVDCRLGDALQPNHARCADDRWCDADGTCKPDLAGGAPCSEDAQCPSNECVDSVCKKEQGEACTGDQCESETSCQDGYCCNAACDGPCEACNITDLEGTCTAVTNGGTPEHACQPSEPACGAGFCNGVKRAECVFTVGTPCGATSCLDGKVNGDLCDISGACAPDTELSCGRYACADDLSTCVTSCTNHNQCAPDSYCDFDSDTCVLKLANNTPNACTDDAECTSTHCADGFCCNIACENQCEACDVTGHEGECTAVDGAPHGGRPACASTDPTCGGQCDGETRDGCSFPDQTTSCGDPYCNSGVAHPQVCNALGSCVDGTTKNCAPFSCNDDMSDCGSSCTNDLDCAAGATCDSQANECAFTDGTCQPDGFTIKLSNGEERSCSPYVCQNGKGCLRECAGNNECADGYECKGDKCEESADGPSNTAGESGDPDGNNPAGNAGSDGDSGGGGGGCSMTNPTSPGGSRFILGAAALALGIRMRRRRLTQPEVPNSNREP